MNLSKDSNELCLALPFGLHVGLINLPAKIWEIGLSFKIKHQLF